MRGLFAKFALWTLAILLSCSDVAVDAVTSANDGNSDAGDTGDTEDTSTEDTSDTETGTLPEDTDGDLISDQDEDAEDNVDTDDDGTPDFMDWDSDDDGIPDIWEAGDDDLETHPVDTDSDGIPNFRDNDSDQDGVSDGDEDVNGNGEQDPGETDPLDDDSDDDGVSDLVEIVAGTDPLDPGDNPAAHGNFVFLVPYDDAPEPVNGEIRFNTSVSKVDIYLLENISKSLKEELAAIQSNLSALLNEVDCDDGESFASCPQDCLFTCPNALCEVGESPATCPADCLGLCGDGICIGNENSVTCAADCPSSCGDRSCDPPETPYDCPSDCTGDCGDGFCHPGEQTAVTGCVVDVWSGAGVAGTANIVQAACETSELCSSTNSGTFLYRNLLNVQSDPTKTMAAVPDDCWGQTCWDPNLSALFYTVTGYGTASAIANGYTVPPAIVPEPPECPALHRGYPCFRPDSLPIVLLVTDEKFAQCYLPDGAILGDCVDTTHPVMELPDFPVVSGAVNDLGAKVVGIIGQVAQEENLLILNDEFSVLCSQTGSIGSDGAPLVFSGADEGAAAVLTTAIKSIARGVPLDMGIRAKDDTTDAVDAVMAFVDHIEVYRPGTPECIYWPSVSDGDADGASDTYKDVPSGMPVCWRLFAKSNLVVTHTDAPQIFKANLYLYGDDLTILDTRVVFFVVPPDISQIPPV